MQRDVLSAEDLSMLTTRLKEAKRALARREAELMTQAEASLEEIFEVLSPPRRDEALRGLFDTLVVSLSVAACIRALFYQPFKIPTGSMQPTLYGIQSIDLPESAQAWYDAQPMRFCRWLLTGDAWHTIRAESTGAIVLNRSGSARPGYMELRIAGKPHYIPNDAFERNALRCRVGTDGKPRAIIGDILWSGRIVSGDFLFVNRWIWNFRHPKRGEVMVFSTNGIKGLQPGTHYIKRMCGLPNETISINAPKLLVNGRAVREPEVMSLITDKLQCRQGALPYSGFSPAQSETPFAQTLSKEGQSVKLGRDQYYALGDNSFNSYDSRYWGSVRERNLLGPASFVHWPFLSPRWGRVR